MDESFTGGAGLSHQATRTFGRRNSLQSGLGRAGSGLTREDHRRMLNSRRASDNSHPDRLS
jgi:hypothetical protein